MRRASEEKEEKVNWACTACEGVRARIYPRAKCSPGKKEQNGERKQWKRERETLNALTERFAERNSRKFFATLCAVGKI